MMDSAETLEKVIWKPKQYSNQIIESLPSLGIVKIGICVIEPFLPSTRPALYGTKYF